MYDNMFIKVANKMSIYTLSMRTVYKAKDFLKIP